MERILKDLIVSNDKITKWPHRNRRLRIEIVAQGIDDKCAPFIMADGVSVYRSFQVCRMALI